MIVRGPPRHRPGSTQWLKGKETQLRLGINLTIAQHGFESGAGPDIHRNHGRDLRVLPAKAL